MALTDDQLKNARSVLAGIYASGHYQKLVETYVQQGMTPEIAHDTAVDALAQVANDQAIAVKADRENRGL